MNTADTPLPNPPPQGGRGPIPEAAIAVSGLRKVYGSKVALHDLTLRVGRGEVFGFLGPNGAGKTTAVKLLAGLTRPTSGTGQVLGRPLGDRGARRRLGYLPELFRFQEWLTATELLEVHAKLSGLSSNERRQRIPELLDLVGLGGRENDRIGSFSKGMQQRVGLAQALLSNPELVILDEPTSALDPLGRRDVRAIIQRLRSEGVTVFLNSHLLGEVELVCDYVAFVKQGQVVREGRTSDLLGDGTELLIRAGGLTSEIIGTLAPRWPVLSYEGEHLVLRVTTPAEAGDVARVLVDLGVSLLELAPRRSNLEQLFLDLVEGEKPGEAERDNGYLDVRPVDLTRGVA